MIDIDDVNVHEFNAQQPDSATDDRIPLGDGASRQAAINRLARNLSRLGSDIFREAKPAVSAAAAAGLMTAMIGKSVRKHPLGGLLMATAAGYALTMPRGMAKTKESRGHRGDGGSGIAGDSPGHPIWAGLGKAALHLVVDGLTALSLADKFEPHE